MAEIASSGRDNLQILYMTSNVVSLERNDAKKYFDWRVVIWIALGMTNAVVLRSRDIIS